MNSNAQFEGSASRSRSKHEGESSYALCDRPSRTRDTSQRQLPTDHDYALPTREYQTDQSSPKPAPTAAGPVLENGKSNNNDKNNSTDKRELTGSLHIRAFSTGLFTIPRALTLRVKCARRMGHGKSCQLLNRKRANEEPTPTATDLRFWWGNQISCAWQCNRGKGR
jgi:hypothetical protein